MFNAAKGNETIESPEAEEHVAYRITDMFIPGCCTGRINLNPCTFIDIEGWIIIRII